MSGLAKVLEYAARDEKVQVIEDITPSFLDEWRSYKVKLSPYMEEDTEKKTVEDVSVILTYLDMLKGAMEDMDIDVMDGIMEQLRQYIFEDEVESIMEQLGVAVTYLDGEKALPLIQKIKKEICKEQGEQ